MISNIQLWFARDINCTEGDDICHATSANLDNEYVCPICGSRVVPKGTKEGSLVTPHFAHINKDMCSTESMIHWWFKNKFICVGDVFSVKTNEVKTYVCRDILVENVVDVDGETYKPDTTIITDDGAVYFEFMYSNKKKIDDYMNVWNKLGCVVVEIDIRNYTSDDKVFNAIYYKGKVFKKNKKYSRMQSYIERNNLDKNENIDTINRIKRLNWFWTDALRFKEDKISIEDLICSIDALDGADRKIVEEFFSAKSCINVRSKFLKDFTVYISELNNDLISKLKSYDGFEISTITGRHFNKNGMSLVLYYKDRYNDVCAEYFNCMSTNLKEDVRNYIIKIYKEYNFNENVSAARNNKVLSSVIALIDDEMKKANEKYHIYTRFSAFGLYISLYFNSHRCMDINLENNLDVIKSNDFEHIYSIVKTYIEEYLKERDVNNDISNIISGIDKWCKDIYIISNKYYDRRRFLLDYIETAQDNGIVKLSTEDCDGYIDTIFEIKFKNNILDNTNYKVLNENKFKKHIEQIVKYQMNKFIGEDWKVFGNIK